jgi:hypothetical protein
MFGIASFVGVLVLFTWLLTSLFDWLLRRWINSPIPRLLVAAVVSLALCTVAGGYGFAGGGPPDFAGAFLIYVLPQLVSLGLMFLFRRGRKVPSKP